MTKERRNPAPARHRRTVVERGYFHTGNSGISISMVEEVQNRDWDAEDRDWYDHHLEVRHSAHGAGSTFKTPIAGPTMCEYYIEAFTRLRNRMLNDPNYRLPSTFERYTHPEMEQQPKQRGSDTHRIADIVDGLKREEVWSPEIIVSECSTETRLLGHNFLDEEGKIVRFEPYRGEKIVTGRSGSRACYKPEDIGKPVPSEIVGSDATLVQGTVSSNSSKDIVKEGIKALTAEDLDQIEARVIDIAKGINEALNNQDAVDMAFLDDKLKAEQEERKKRGMVNARDLRDMLEPFADGISQHKITFVLPFVGEHDEITVAEAETFVSALREEVEIASGKKNEAVEKECKEIKRLAGIGAKKSAVALKAEQDLADKLEAAEAKLGIKAARERLYKDFDEGMERLRTILEPDCDIIVDEAVTDREKWSIMDSIKHRTDEELMNWSKLDPRIRGLTIMTRSKPVRNWIEVELAEKPLVAHMKTLYWLCDTDPKAEVYYSGAWQEVQANDLRASMVADSMTDGDLPVGLKVRVATDVSTLFKRLFA